MVVLSLHAPYRKFIHRSVVDGRPRSFGAELSREEISAVLMN